MRKIEFYRMSDGQCPVEEFIDTLPDKVAQKTLAVFKIIEETPIVPIKFLKKLSGTDIWECRVEYESNIYRYLGFFTKNAIVILTNGFQKKSQKTPRRFIDIAEEYKTDYMRKKK